MPEPKNYVFDHAELAEVLVKQADVHEGLWGVYLELGLAGANMPTTPDAQTYSPAAITFINKIGIQRFDTSSNLTVDAAVVNPLPGASKKKRRP